MQRINHSSLGMDVMKIYFNNPKHSGRPLPAAIVTILVLNLYESAAFSERPYVLRQPGSTLPGTSPFCIIPELGSLVDLYIGSFHILLSWPRISFGNCLGQQPSAARFRTSSYVRMCDLTCVALRFPFDPRMESANGASDDSKIYIPAPFVASGYANDGKKHLLLGASGSVATIKIPTILRALSDRDDLSIRVILSRAAQNFLMSQSAEQPAYQSLARIRNVDGVYLDEDEWIKPWVRGDGILHIELRRWSDLMVIAPLSADTMAKMCSGFADNLLLSVVRAWDTTGQIEGSRRKTIMVAPSMNTAMWHHPVTKKHMHTLESEWGIDKSDQGWIEVLRPIEKPLACGDSGDGAMVEWSTIVEKIEDHLDLAEHEIMNTKHHPINGHEA